MTTRETKINLLGLSLPKMQAFFHELGEKPFRASQTLKWIHQRGVIDINLMTDISKPLRERMKAVAEVRPPLITQEYRSADGSCKWIVQVESGSSVEMVFPNPGGARCACPHRPVAVWIAVSVQPASRVSTATSLRPRSSASCGGQT